MSERVEHEKGNRRGGVLIDPREIHAFLNELVPELGEIARRGFEDPGPVRFKSKGQPVTEIDHAIEERARDAILSTWPDTVILGEESGLTEGGGKTTWFIDPIDGTMNFARGIPLFSVSIGAAQQGRMVVGHVLDPLRHEHFRACADEGAWLGEERIRVSEAATLDVANVAMQTTAGGRFLKQPGFMLELHRRSRKTRKFGSIALEMAWVSCGRLDLVFAGKEKPQEWWDIAGGWALVEEAGGVVEDLEGRPLQETSSHLVAGPESLVEDFRAFYASLEAMGDS
jgi:myo-inositol-1(or 4)-monophosphatase